MFDLSSTVWWSTVAELFTFFYCFLIFMIDAQRMAFVWMFMPHIFRAIMGLALIKKLPTTHEMVANVNIKPPEKIPFSLIDKVVFRGAIESLEKFQTAAGKLVLIYTLLSAICVILDFIVIFIGVAGLNPDQGAFGTVFVLLIGILYFLYGLFFIGWVISVRMRLPAYAQTMVMMGLFGLFKKLSEQLHAKYKEIDPNSAILKTASATDPAASAS